MPYLVGMDDCAQVVLPTPTPATIHRKILCLDWSLHGQNTKALEAVTRTDGNVVSLYYQVTQSGREILETISLAEALERYHNII